MNDAFNSTRFNSTTRITNNHFSIFRKVISELRGYSGDLYFITASPKSILEGVGITIAIILTLILFKFENDKAFAILGILALGLQRILPRANILYQCFSKVKASIAITSKLTADLKLKKDPALEFLKKDINKDAFLYFKNYPSIIYPTNLKITLR